MLLKAAASVCRFYSSAAAAVQLSLQSLDLILIPMQEWILLYFHMLVFIFRDQDEGSQLHLSSLD